MSDRKSLLNIYTSDKQLEGVELFMDGESGTWRLFLETKDGEHPCVDFSLAALREFANRLLNILRDVESDPDAFNAEVRRSWHLMIPNDE